MTHPRSRVLAVLAAVVLLLTTLVALPRTPVAQGFLLALAVWSGFPLGSLVLRMVYGLTGGAWGTAIAPSLRIGTKLAMLAVAAIALLAFLQHDIYSWVDHPPGGARHLFLSVRNVRLRGLAILAVWLVLAFIFKRDRASTGLAGLGMTLYAIALSFAAADWFMSVDPQRLNSSFGVMLGIQQMLTALSIAALLLPHDMRTRDISDIAGLMIACLLGLIYLELMTFIVDWYGDLPQKVAWYLRRTNRMAHTALGTSILCAVASLATLIAHRGNLRQIQISATVILISIAAHWTWLLLPDFDRPGPALFGASAGLLALSLLTVAVEPDLRFLQWQAVEDKQKIHMERLPRALEPARPKARHTIQMSIPLQSPEVAAGHILAVILCFATFVAVSLGALRYVFDRSQSSALSAFKPASGETDLIISETLAARLKSEQLTQIGAAGDEDGQGLGLSRAQQIVVRRGIHAYDPVSLQDLSEARP